jgi:hypothetical protein
MMKNRKENTLDYTNSLTKGFNEQNKAFDTVSVNDLVPVRYGKILLTYVTSGFGLGKIQTASYYSDGVYQETKITTRGNNLGSAHKTTLNFINKTPDSLAGRSLVIFDDIGGVLLWFNVDGLNVAPVVEATYRSLEINLLSTDSHELVAQKTSETLSIDSQFVSLYTSYFIVISSLTSGSKPNSYDINTLLTVKNTSGYDPVTLNNTYFFLNSANNLTEYYFWYNVSGSGIDPSIFGKTGVMVSISSVSNSAQVANYTKNAIDSTLEFITNIEGDVLSISNDRIGVTAAFQENTAGFSIINSKAGEDRELIAKLVLVYDSNDCISSVERL